MDTVNQQTLQAGPCEDGEGQQQQLVLVPMQVDGMSNLPQCGNGGSHEVEEALVSSGLSGASASAVQSRTSELTIAFEGEVYVFQAVTPEQVPFFLCCQVIDAVFTCFPTIGYCEF